MRNGNSWVVPGSCAEGRDGEREKGQGRPFKKGLEMTGTGTQQEIQVGAEGTETKTEQDICTCLSSVIDKERNAVVCCPGPAPALVSE